MLRKLEGAGIMEKILSVFLSIVMLFSITAGLDLSAYAETNGDLQYTVLDNGTATITGYNGSPTDLKIPSTIDGHTVTSISDYAFYWRESITSVTIPDSVTTIGTGAFMGTSLKSVTIPNGVSTIENSVFQSCLSLTSVTLPSRLIKIGDFAFEECEKLTDITIPSSVREIGSGAFSRCSSLKSVTIPIGITKIYNNAFSDCLGLTNITIPNAVTEIGGGAFSGCENVTSITIPSSVRTINDSAFAYCKSLKSVTIPSSVETLGKHVFESCESITSISVNSNNPNYSSLNGTLFNKNKTELIQYPSGSSLTQYDVPNGVTKICDRAFGYCRKLTSVTISNTVTTIESFAFNDCSGLVSVYIPNSVTSIGDSVFSFCKNLKNITIPSSVTSIGDYTFQYCSSLTNVTIPDSVTHIGSWAYSDCTSLTNVIIPNSVTELGYNVFYNCRSLTGISVGDNNPNYSSYNGVLFNKDKTVLIKYPTNSSATAYSIPNSVTTIEQYAFENCTGLTSITIPDSVTTIEEYAFSNCTGLISLTVPNSVTTVKYAAFENISNVIYNGTLDTSEWRAKATNGFVDGYLVFKDSTKTELLGCSSQASAVTIPNSVTRIGNNAFAYCSKLTSITIPDSVTTIDYSAFIFCTGLTSFTIGKGLESIKYVFSGCESLSAFSVSDENSTYSSIDGVLFNKDKTELILYPMGNSRTAYTIPDGVITISEEAFAECAKLRSVTIPKSIKSIGFFAFGVNRTLTDVYYEGSEAEWINIEIEWHNDNLIKANIHYNSAGPCVNHKAGTAVKENVKNATCKAEGSYDSVVYCSVCNSEISRTTKVIPKSAHKYDAGKVTKSATCTATGVKTYTCTVCGVTKTEAIAKKAHTYKSYVTKATLTANGKIVSKCSVCGAVKSTTAIPLVKTVTISATNYNYDGKVKTPTVTVKDSKGKALRKGTDYDVTYSSDRKSVGKYSVKVTLKGNYSGTKTLYFNINPKGTTIAKITPKSKSLTVQWNKQTSQTTGYQIQYSTSSKFTNAKTVTMSKNSYYSRNITGLAGNKRYYVRVRTYKTVRFNGKNYDLYSSWSSAKYATTKR